MSFKDLTDVRVRQLRKNLKVFIDDLDDLLKSRNNFVAFSKHSVEKDNDLRLKRPSEFYFYRDFLRSIYIDYKNDVYSVRAYGCYFTNDSIKSITCPFFSNENICRYEIELGCSVFVGFSDLTSAYNCFISVIKAVLFGVYPKQKELF